MQNKKGFSLIEIMVASVIISITIFGVLRLTNNNYNQIKVIEKNSEILQIANNSRECIKSFGHEYLSGLTATESINFGNDGTKCLTGNYNNNLTFSGIKIKKYNNEIETNPDEFWNYIKTSSGGSGIVNVKNYITDGTNIKNFEFKIYK